MIEINDSDSPIQVAEKIINGTKEITVSPMMKSLRKAFGSKSIDIDDSDNDTKSVVDMFDIDEIKEIADYLMIYYKAHNNGD